MSTVSQFQSMIISCFFLGLFFMFPFTSNAQTFSSPAALSGFAWSPNIGWISFAGDNYGVGISPNGNIDGFAWSPNIGWIKFGKSGGCPAGSCRSKINLSSNQFSGWARALNAGEGWDGWISLHASNHGGATYGAVARTSGKLGGFVWGANVVGWTNFSTVSIDTPCTAVTACTADGTGVETVDMWCKTKVDSCTVDKTCQPTTATCEKEESFMTVEPSVVRTGDTATVTWSADPGFYSSCVIEGHGDRWTGLSELSGRTTSAFGKNSSIYRLMCIERSSGSEVEVERVEIRVLPTISEI